MKENGPRLRRWRCPLIRHYREYPSGSFLKPLSFFYKWHFIIKDVPSEQQIPGRTKTSQTEGEGGGILFFFYRNWKHGTVSFLTLRHYSQHKTYFCFLLTLNVKNTLHLVDGNIRLQLVESFSNFGLHLSEELLIMRAVLVSVSFALSKSYVIVIIEIIADKKWE